MAVRQADAGFQLIAVLQKKSSRKVLYTPLLKT